MPSIKNIRDRDLAEYSLDYEKSHSIKKLADLWESTTAYNTPHLKVKQQDMHRIKKYIQTIMHRIASRMLLR